MKHIVAQVLRDAGVGLKSVYVARRAAALRNADGIDGIIQRCRLTGGAEAVDPTVEAIVCGGPLVKTH